MAWPELAGFTVGSLLLLAVLATLRLSAAGVAVAGAALRGRSVVLVAGGLLVWAVGRALAAGLPGVGMENLITLLLGAVAAWVAVVAVRLEERRGETLPVWIGALVAGTILCCLYAVCQRLFLYDRMLERMQSDLAGAAESYVEKALLHHLMLRRVASIWGDPNAFAAFSALGFSASLGLLATSHAWPHRRRAVGVLVALIGAYLALVGIGFSGSRGGVLDVGLVLLLLGIGQWRGHHSTPRVPTVLAVGATIVFALGTIAAVSQFQRPARGAAAAVSAEGAAVEVVSTGGGLWGMLQRVDTVRERLRYWTIGKQLILERPLLGHGPGAVERHYPRLKTPEAREAKYLHNWVLMFAVEYGLVGLGLAVALLAAVGWRWCRALRGSAYESALAAAAIAFVFDGLLQLSWNTRELFVVFAAIGSAAWGLSSEPDDAASVPVQRGWRVTELVGVAVVLCATAVLALPWFVSRTAMASARDAMAEGRFADALMATQRALRYAPYDSVPLATRAILATREGRPDAARLYLKQARDREPFSASLCTQSAEVEETLREYDKARAFFEQALRIYPSSPTVHRAYAGFLERRGDRTGALEHAEAAVKFGYLDLAKDTKYLQDLKARFGI